MNVPDEPDGAARLLFEEITGHPPERIEWLSGAMAGRTALVATVDERFFVKWSQTAVGARALDAEADGLRRMHASCPDHVVRLIGVASAESGTGTLLVLEYVDSEPHAPAGDYNAALANALATLHASQAELYGLDRDNFIGATPQTNSRHTTWPEFFADERLRAMAKKLRDRDRWPGHWTAPFDRLLQQLPDLVPERPVSSLLHGDLWSGNVLTGRGGKPVLIDPAVYHGHAETDLAMMQLFGGFGTAVFDAYDHIAGIEPGFGERAGIYNLYHLLNHVLLFGAGYHGGVEKTLARF